MTLFLPFLFARNRSWSWPFAVPGNRIDIFFLQLLVRLLRRWEVSFLTYILSFRGIPAEIQSLLLSNFMCEDVSEVTCEIIFTHFYSIRMVSNDDESHPKTKRVSKPNTTLATMCTPLPEFGPGEIWELKKAPDGGRVWPSPPTRVFLRAEGPPEGGGAVQ